ncbi:uncharacterized protein LY89DRAFT_728428 [Mollisia scopiformis]|uniref:Uncharacterized protein n=1 Tax=Mollisia scopiformis TaxID=149040 RepID=A0A194XQ30_MOLSC|nr:uncharacterized protein LY89DRAFT_728428 [Mollisia scopiformis]KUJ22266.1 hypothetical protein LY89DRAFT_728428 [Mollisia scopiformis]
MPPIIHETYFDSRACSAARYPSEAPEFEPHVEEIQQHFVASTEYGSYRRDAIHKVEGAKRTASSDNEEARNRSRPRRKSNKVSDITPPPTDIAAARKSSIEHKRRPSWQLKRMSPYFGFLRRSSSSTQSDLGTVTYDPTVESPESTNEESLEQTGAGSGGVLGDVSLSFDKVVSEISRM